MSLGVVISTAGAGPRVAGAIARAVQGARLQQVIGRAAVNAIRTHLFTVNVARPNALGGKRTNFYASAARGTSFTAVADGVVVSVSNVGIRQRILGGTIRPRTAKFLTIPATAEAHGKRASEFDDLVVVFGSRGQPIALAHALFRRTRAQLAAIPASRRVGMTRTAGQHGGIVFWLRRSVTQAPDPSVLPTEAEIYRAAGVAVDAVVLRAVARAQGGAA